MKNNVLIIGVAGGTGSGKSFFTKELISNLQKKIVSTIEQDSYYKDLSKLQLKERSKINFDHPSSIDFKLLKKHLHELSNGKSIKKPIYDFKTHTRNNKFIMIQSRKIIILEGLFILWDSEIRKMLDIKIYIDTPKDERLIRRINRDLVSRGRTLLSILDQYNNTVKPMHDQFIKNTKHFADLIIPGDRSNQIIIDLIKTKISNNI